MEVETGMVKILTFSRFCVVSTELRKIIHFTKSNIIKKENFSTLLLKNITAVKIIVLKVENPDVLPIWSLKNIIMVLNKPWLYASK
jgi:hypothetical protein